MTTTYLQAHLLSRVEDLFLRFGIKSITMDDVASELGISKKTLYQWFESKDDLVFKVLDHHISREKSMCLKRAAEAKNAIDEILVLIESNSQELANMRTNIVNDLQKYHPNTWEMIRKFQYDFVYRIIRDNLERGRKEGLYREDFDPDIIAKLHLAGAFSLFDSQLFPDNQISRVELFHQYIMHFLFGIVSPKGAHHLKKKLN